MINLYDSGVYLVNGTEIIADGADAAAELKAKTGKEICKEQAAKGTIAYRILEEHNTSRSVGAGEISGAVCVDELP